MYGWHRDLKVVSFFSNRANIDYTVTNLYVQPLTGKKGKMSVRTLGVMPIVTDARLSRSTMEKSNAPDS